MCRCWNGQDEPNLDEGPLSQCIERFCWESQYCIQQWPLGDEIAKLNCSFVKEGYWVIFVSIALDCWKKMAEIENVGADGKACRILYKCVDLHRSFNLGEVVGGFTNEKFCVPDGGKGKWWVQ